MRKHEAADHRVPSLYQMDKEEREELFFGIRIGIWLLNYWYAEETSRAYKPEPKRR